MKLLFDQNLSPFLARRLADLYPDASHVSLVGLDRASDDAVWAHARINDCIVVTKDADFSDMSVVRGSPPKVIWLRLKNCTTDDVERTLRGGYPLISAFADDPTAGLLELL